MTEDKILNIPQAAKILKVSEATVRNWIKSGLLISPLSYSDVSSVKESLSSGKIQRLNKRANKTKSSKSFLPSEYTNHKKNDQYINQIIGVSNLHFKSIEETIFNIAISFVDEKELDDNKHFYFKRGALQKVFDEFNNNKFLQNSAFIFSISPIISKLKSSNSHDVLGLLYQSLQTEGDKSLKGSYYTPIEIIDEMINDLNGDIETFLDPCCGTGAFILSAIKNKNIQAQNIYGADIDKTAVFLARINILEFFQDYDKVPNIFHLDSLKQLATGEISCKTNYLKGKIDAIATNPPWGASKNSSAYSEYVKQLGSKEIFSMFLLKSIELLSTSGELHFLLPESVLNIRTHKKIRNILCTRTKLISIKEFGKVFTGVYTPVISIHAKIAKNANLESVTIRAKDKTYTVNQERFLETKHNIYDIKIDDRSKILIDKIYSIPHITLINNASWALGIVTGNNAKFLHKRNDGDLEPIYKGSDINCFYLNKASNYVKYNRQSFQQVSKDKYFRANEKLVYKFISNKLVFAYDDKQSLTLNSANILIPNLSNMPIKVVLAFLNSEVFQFLHKIKFSTQKILRGNLEELPFPIIDDKMQVTIINHVNKAIAGDIQVIKKINEIIYSAFELNREEIEIIKKYLK